MTTQLLIYEHAVPVNSQRHGDWSVKAGADYGFARHVNAVPLMATEFQAAAAEYAIVFTGTEDAVMPAVILGVRERENLFIAEAGSWRAKYIPAFLRRYPFVFSSTENGSTFTLCIDEEFAGINQDGRGERLFDSQGERTQYLQNVLGFLQVFQAQFNRTQAFCKRVQELKLLEPMQAQFTLNTGQKLALTGFQAINRQRLNALDGEQLATLAKADELELLYTHLLSMQNFRPMVERVAASTDLSTEETPAEPGGEPDAALAIAGDEVVGDEKRPEARKRNGKAEKAD